MKRGIKLLLSVALLVALMGTSVLAASTITGGAKGEHVVGSKTGHVITATTNAELASVTVDGSAINLADAESSIVTVEKKEAEVKPSAEPSVEPSAAPEPSEAPEEPSSAPEPSVEPSVEPSEEPEWVPPSEMPSYVPFEPLSAPEASEDSASTETTYNYSITLTAKYLDKLSAGDHKVKVSFKDDTSVDATVTVKKAAAVKAKTVRTGDTTSMIVYMLVLVLAGGAYAFANKKERN